jgi:hypothetical protein
MGAFRETVVGGARPEVYGNFPVQKRSNGRPFILGAALMVLGLGAVGYGKYHEYQVVSAIQHHGARQEAAVLRIYQKVISKGNYKHLPTCYVIADYQITPQGWSHPLNGSMRLADCNQNNTTVTYATQNNSLPIAYDLTNPRVVHLNFNDEVFREDVGRTMKAQILIFLCFVALGVSGVTALSMMRKS